MIFVKQRGLHFRCAPGHKAGQVGTLRARGSWALPRGGEVPLGLPQASAQCKLSPVFFLPLSAPPFLMVKSG